MSRSSLLNSNSAVILGVLVIIGVGCEREQVMPSAGPSGPSVVSVQPKASQSEVLEKYSCGTVERLHTWNGIFAGSQPAAADLRHAQANGIKTILSLRPDTEDRGFDEKALVKELGMEYAEIPFASAADMSDEALDRARALLSDSSKRPLFIHCHSGNRVGAVWLAFRTLDGGLTYDAALAEAKQVGLKTPALEQRAQEYIDRKRAASRTK